MEIQRVALDTIRLKTIPQVVSTTVTITGQSFITAWFVRSYVAYVTSPKRAALIKNLTEKPLSIFGTITKYAGQRNPGIIAFVIRNFASFPDGDT